MNKIMLLLVLLVTLPFTFSALLTQPLCGNEICENDRIYNETSREYYCPEDCPVYVPGNNCPRCEDSGYIRPSACPTTTSSSGGVSNNSGGIIYICTTFPIICQYWWVLIIIIIILLIIVFYKPIKKIMKSIGIRI